jgi:hypothetical protein
MPKLSSPVAKRHWHKRKMTLNRLQGLSRSIDAISKQQYDPSSYPSTHRTSSSTKARVRRLGKQKQVLKVLKLVSKQQKQTYKPVH